MKASFKNQLNEHKMADFQSSQNDFKKRSSSLASLKNKKEILNYKMSLNPSPSFQTMNSHDEQNEGILPMLNIPPAQVFKNRRRKTKNSVRRRSSPNGKHLMLSSKRKRQSRSDSRGHFNPKISRNDCKVASTLSNKSIKDMKRASSELENNSK